jgi:hypothetical protein
MPTRHPRFYQLLAGLSHAQLSRWSGGNVAIRPYSGTNPGGFYRGGRSNRAVELDRYHRQLAQSPTGTAGSERAGVNRAFADLIGRGYDRREIEAVFRRFKSRPSIWAGSRRPEADGAGAFVSGKSGPDHHESGSGHQPAETASRRLGRMRSYLAASRRPPSGNIPADLSRRPRSGRSTPHSRPQLVFRRDPETGVAVEGRLRWRLIPHYAEARPDLQLIHARAETISENAD